MTVRCGSCDFWKGASPDRRKGRCWHPTRQGLFTRHDDACGRWERKVLITIADVFRSKPTPRPKVE